MDDGIPDEELMLGVRSGNETAFAALYHRHKQGVVAFCTQMLRSADDADDVFQETFRYLFRQAPSYQPTAKFTTFLYRIARNLCIDILRRRRRWNLQALDPAADAADDRPAPKTRLEEQEIELGIKESLAEIPEPYREVLLFRLTRNLAYEEIAELAGVPVGTVKSRLHAGFELLRKSLRRKKMDD